MSHTICQWRSDFDHKNAIQRMATELCGISSGEKLLLRKSRSERNLIYSTFLIIRDATQKSLRYIIPCDSIQLITSSTRAGQLPEK